MNAACESKEVTSPDEEKYRPLVLSDQWPVLQQADARHAIIGDYPARLLRGSKPAGTGGWQ
ncbi:MAG: hypothetical protein LXA50_18375 [Betaproteobacteria bacterium]|nr:hypothetical protein [Betaproteobacteria bacterium]